MDWPEDLNRPGAESEHQFSGEPLHDGSGQRFTVGAVLGEFLSAFHDFAHVGFAGGPGIDYIFHDGGELVMA